MTATTITRVEGGEYRTTIIDGCHETVYFGKDGATILIGRTPVRDVTYRHIEEYEAAK